MSYSCSLSPENPACLSCFRFLYLFIYQSSVVSIRAECGLRESQAWGSNQKRLNETKSQDNCSLSPITISGSKCVPCRIGERLKGGKKKDQSFNRCWHVNQADLTTTPACLRHKRACVQVPNHCHATFYYLFFLLLLIFSSPQIMACIR